MKRNLPLLISLLLFLAPLIGAEEAKVKEAADIRNYRDIGITEKGFEVKDPYALPVYEPRSTSLLPFHEEISALLNSYLVRILSGFDLKEAFALRILFEDIKPLLSFIGNLISIPLTLAFIPLLSIARLIKAPLDILQFLITALLDPVISIPAHEIEIMERFSLSLKNLFYLPSMLLKPLEFLVYTPDPLAALASISFSGALRSFLSPFSAIASTISRAIDFIPFLNIAKGFFTAYLLLLFRFLMNIPLSLVTYLLSPYRGALNILLLPISLSFIALDSLFSPMRSLLSFLLLPILFLLRIPLTPPLILFNFFSHSLQGFGQFLRSFSNPAAILLVSLATLVLLPFVSSPIISVLFVSPAAPVLLFGSIAIGMSLLLGVLALLIPALAFVLFFFTGILLSALAGALVLLSALSFTGLIAGAILALILICLIVSGYTPAAVMMGVATGGIAIPPETILLIVLCLGIFVLGVAGGALSGLILGVALIPLAALITGTLAAAILLPLLLLSGSLMLTVLLLVPLIALTSVILPVLLLSALFLAVALLALTGSLLVALPLFLGILFLLMPVGFLALLSILSPELFRVVFPPELIEIAKRIALLPRDAVRIINGLIHLPVDIMRAIAVLDAPVNDGGGGDGVQKTYSIVISSASPSDKIWNRDAIARGEIANESLSKISDGITYLKVSDTEDVTAKDINNAIANYKAMMDEDDVLIVVFSGHGERGKYTGEDAVDDETEDGYIQLQGQNANEFENYYDDQYVSALKGIKGSVVTVAASCFSGGFTDDLEREGIKGIHISTTDNKTVAVDDFIPAFFEALGSGASVNEAFDAGFNKNNESYGSESFWNETVKEDDEGWYYKHIHLEYNETETVREYLHRRANMTDEDVTLLEKNYNETSLNQTMATFLNQTTQKEREGFYHINQTVTPYIENQTVRDYYLTTFSDRVNESTLGPAVVPISRPAGVEDITFTLKGGGTEPPEAGTEAVAPAAMEEGPRIPW